MDKSSRWTLFAMALLSGQIIIFGACSSTPEPTDTPAPAALALPSSETVCDDGKDEDGDGATDCGDRDCAASTVCQIARCAEVCADIMACADITEACNPKELTYVLKNCQASCADDKIRGQVVMADGVPCIVIGSVFLSQVQSSNICLGEDAAEGTDAAAPAPSAG
jgi:hypothetical protein